MVFSKVMSLRLTVAFWSVLELSFSLFCRNPEHQGCLSYNSLSIFVFLIFFSDLVLYLECFAFMCMCTMCVDHVFVPPMCTTCANCVCLCVCTVCTTCVYTCVWSLWRSEEDRDKSVVNHCECVWWELDSRACARATRALNGWTISGPPLLILLFLTV